MKSPLLHLANVIYGNPLAIIPEKMDAILRAIGPRLTFDQSALQSLIDSHSLASNPKLSADLFAFDEDEREERDGEASKPYKLTEAGIAVVPIRGALLKRGGWLAAASGISSYDSISRSFSAAIRDPLVKAILFSVDSPGGTTNGCFELSDLIYNSRGDKPIWGCADDMAGSAAYALISSCDHVCLTRTAAIGSIGVFALHCDQSALDEKVGAKFTYIFAGDKKVDGNPHEPLSRSAKRDMQAEVDRQYEIFVTTVARNRDTSRDKIRGTEAGVLFADAAIPLLADQVATFDETMAELTRKIGGKSGKSKSVTSNGAGNGALASATDSCDNVADTGSTLDTERSTEQSTEEEGENAMAALDAKKGDAAPDMKKGSAADDKPKKKAAGKECAAEPEEDEDEPGNDDEEAEAESAEMEDDDDEKPAPKKKGTVTPLPVAASAATEIAELCAIAGMDELTGKYIRKGYTVTQVRQFLQARRAKLSAANSVDTSHSGQGNGGGNMTLDEAVKQARTMALNSGGTISQSKALETILANNPSVYDQYDEDRQRLANSGTRRDWQAYVNTHQVRLMRSLGLSTAIDEVPAARQM